MTGQKRRARPDSPMAGARITLPPPPMVPPFPAWARMRSIPKTPEEAGFLAGAALAALHPLACHDHPIGVLWRQRLALANGAALARHAGRTEDEAALRPATAGAMPGIFAMRLRSRTRRPLVASLAAARRARSARPSDSPGAPAERLDAWIVGRARCLLMMRSRTSATLPRRWPQGRECDRGGRMAASACKNVPTPKRSPCGSPTPCSLPPQMAATLIAGQIRRSHLGAAAPMILSPWPAASICAPAGSSPMPSTWRWGSARETAVARRESGPHWDCVFSADRPRRALATVRQAGEPRHHRPIAGAEFHCRRPAQSAAGRALHLRHHQTIPAHFGFDTLRDLPDIEQLEETGLLNKQKLLAGEALAVKAAASI